jgi:membrane protease YdiL (CAAX protease family)
VARVVIYSVSVNVLAWWGSSLGGDPASPGLGFLIWGTAPAVVALAMRAITRDWSDFGARPSISRYGAWYLVSAMAFPLALAVALVLGTATGASTVSGSSWSAFRGAAGTGMLTFFVFALFEEVGWRGYLAPKLYSLHMNVFIAHTLVALVWASWHLPYIAELSSYTTEATATFIPRFYLGTAAFSILLGEIRIITATFWPAVLMHWIGNAIANPLAAEVVTLTPGREYLGSIGIDGASMIVCLGGLGLAVHRWRTRTTA